jgi:hypothetical protein
MFRLKVNNSHHEQTGRNRLISSCCMLSALLLTAVLPFKTAAISYSGSWVGNSFGDGRHWVQNFIQGMVVDPDGRIRTSSYWDEGGTEYGMYKDCQPLGQGQPGVSSLSAGGWSIENYYGRFTWDNPMPIPANKPVIRGPGGKTITSIEDPTALAMDNQGRLMVADGGPDQDIKVFDVAGEPKLVETIGEKGGFLSGIPGFNEPLKFNGIRGLGMDAAGNLYVGNSGYMSQCGGGTDIRVFNPQKQMICNLLGLCFVNSADFDPASDGNDIYMNNEHITMDYTQPAGKNWTYHASTIDPFSYPDDPRLLTSLECAFIRRIEGRKIMFLTNMYSEFLVGYRFEGEIAVPCLFWAVGWDGQWDKYKWMIDIRPKYAAQGNTRWLWRDANGDGAVQAGEFSTFDMGYSFNWGMDIDSKGDVFLAGRNIRQFKCGGIDQNGVPLYSPENSTLTPSPEMDVARLRYDDKTDAMYLAYASGAFPNFAKVACYDNWSGSKTQRWSTGLPHSEQDDWLNTIVPVAFAVAGDYVFIAYGSRGPHHDEHSAAPGSRCGEVEMYNSKTGAYVQYLFPTEDLGYQSGAIDLGYAVNAMQRASGEYLVLVEEDNQGKVILYRFDSPPAGSQVAKPSFEPPSAIYENPVTVTLGCATSGATVRYTLDGTEPGPNSAQYAQPFVLEHSALLRVRAFKDGMTPSDIVCADYSIGKDGPYVSARSSASSGKPPQGDIADLNAGQNESPAVKMIGLDGRRLSEVRISRAGNHSAADFHGIAIVRENAGKARCRWRKAILIGR